jgi:hypothetical protein
MLKITIMNSIDDNIYTIEIEGTQTLEDLKVLIEVESGMPISD